MSGDDFFSAAQGISGLLFVIASISMFRNAARSDPAEPDVESRPGARSVAPRKTRWFFMVAGVLAIASAIFRVLT